MYLDEVLYFLSVFGMLATFEMWRRWIFFALNVDKSKLEQIAKAKELRNHFIAWLSGTLFVVVISVWKWHGVIQG